MNKIVVITGPTASGKSEMAIELAKKYKGEIISADSRQVYKDMNIGTGKVKTKPAKKANKEERKLGKCLSGDVVHYLLNVVDPREEIFNMAKFQKLANKAIELIFAKNKLPIIAGGTMLYIDAVVKGYSSPGKSDKALRKKLKDKTTKELLSQLKKIDPKAFKQIDKDNRYRIIRALEVKKTTGKSFFEAQKQESPNFRTLKLVIRVDREKLYRRIDKRVDRRLKKGMIKEVEDLHQSGLSWQRMEKMGLEYGYISRYLKGELKKEEMVKILKNKTHAYARRQISWWRNDKKATWIKDIKQVEEKIDKFI